MSDILIGHVNAPFISSYPFVSGVGFGTKYSNPSTASSSHGQRVAATNKGDFIAAVRQNSFSPFNSICQIYEFTVGVGFGARTASTSIGNTSQGPSGVAFSKDDKSIIISNSFSTSEIRAIPFSTSGTLGASLGSANISTSTAVTDISLNKSDTALVYTSSSGTTHGAIEYDSTIGFGTRYTNASGGIFVPGRSVSYSPNRATIAFVSGNVTPYLLRAIEWDDTTGFGTVYSNPSVAVGNMNAVRFSPTGGSIFVGETSSPYIEGYPWDDTTGFGSKYANPSVLPTGVSVTSSSISLLGQDLVMGHGTTPYISAYPFLDGTGFGVKYADPSVTLAGNGLSTTFVVENDSTSRRILTTQRR